MDILLSEQTVPGLHAALLAALPKLDPATGVLDIGCGTGAWLERLHEAGFSNLLGIDRDAGRFASKHAAFLSRDLDGKEIGLGERRFGLISAIEVIEHLGNPGTLLGHLGRYLAPDGFCVLTTPNIHSVLCRFRFLLKGTLRHFDEHGDPTHVNPVYLPAFHRLVDRHALRVERVWTYPLASAGFGSRWLGRALAWATAPLIGDPLPGDILCVLLTKLR
jgi:SAM-dependent methyltransferase